MEKYIFSIELMGDNDLPMILLFCVIQVEGMEKSAEIIVNIVKLYGEK